MGAARIGPHNRCGAVGPQGEVTVALVRGSRTSPCARRQSRHPAARTRRRPRTSATRRARPARPTRSANVATSCTQRARLRRHHIAARSDGDAELGHRVRLAKGALSFARLALAGLRASHLLTCADAKTDRCCALRHRRSGWRLAHQTTQAPPPIPPPRQTRARGRRRPARRSPSTCHRSPSCPTPTTC